LVLFVIERNTCSDGLVRDLVDALADFLAEVTILGFLVIVTYIPEISLWLPKALGMM
jgi:TRAP-type C4-dicarboxylate transport system permease large subunit